MVDKLRRPVMCFNIAMLCHLFCLFYVFHCVCTMFVAILFMIDQLELRILAKVLSFASLTVQIYTHTKIKTMKIVKSSCMESHLSTDF